MTSPPDTFDLSILFRTNPIQSWDVARPFFEALIREARELAPTTLDNDPPVPLTLAALEQRLRDEESPDLFLTGESDLRFNLFGYGDDRDPGGRVRMSVPLPVIAGKADLILGLVTGLSRVAEPLYGRGHSRDDTSVHRDPTVADPWAPKAVYQAYWLTILGAPMVQELGRDRVAATPAHRVVFLDCGAALIVTSPDPDDATSPAARAAQARALAHLRLDVDEATPTGASAQVGEWRPAAEALPTDVDDVSDAEGHYTDQFEAYIAGFHAEIENLTAGKPDSLPRIDQHFLASDYWSRLGVSRLEEVFVPMLGAYLGVVLVDALGGRWVPRKNLEESQVIVGDRAWLPFLRVKHFVQSRQAAVDHSLAAFFEAAKQHAPSRGDHE